MDNKESIDMDAELEFYESNLEVELWEKHNFRIRQVVWCG